MNIWLIVALIAALAVLLVAIVRLRMHPFLALTVVSLLYGVTAGMPANDAVVSFLTGFGRTLEGIGVVIVLGALIGELLDRSGATLQIATSVIRAVGQKRLPLAMGLTGYVVSIPTFVDVAYVMLKPITEMLAVKSHRKILVVGLSLSAGLTASHALLPPTPGPLAAISNLEADMGQVILLNAVVAAFAMAGGLLWATLYCGRVELAYDETLREAHASEVEREETAAESLPTPAVSFVPILLPLLLIACASFFTRANDPDASWAAGMLRFIGTPVVALLLGMVCALLLLKRGGRMELLSGLVDRSIERAAVVIMITGAGGGFGWVIRESGVGGEVAAIFAGTQLPGLLFPFLMAMALSTATGSITVSATTTSSVVAPMLGTLGVSAELAAALIGAGSLCVIHANASMFWLLSRLHQVPPDVLYRTYSVQSICMACGGMVGVILLILCGVR